MHAGVDISCSGIKGRAIVAAASGTVTTKAYDSGGYGNYIIITHANG
jgi:murein DD-endopeptidase MepM/ murein hydrolase activator NlpD